MTDGRDHLFDPFQVSGNVGSADEDQFSNRAQGVWRVQEGDVSGGVSEIPYTILTVVFDGHALADGDVHSIIPREVNCGNRSLLDP